MEQRPVAEGKSPWDVFAQKYIGSVSECYHMSLKTLCGDERFLATPTPGPGETRYHTCMATYFAGVCPTTAPFPCLNGCDKSYQNCRHLSPSALVPGWFASSSPHVATHRRHFSQFLKEGEPASAAANQSSAANVVRAVLSRLASTIS